MAEIPRLELSQLPEMHPGIPFMITHVPAAIFRLWFDPTLISDRSSYRLITVNHRGIVKSVEVGTGLLPEDVLACSITIDKSFNSQGMTEDAAIVAMALLAHHLEGFILQNVLQIGSGGDFSAYCPRTKTLKVIECSGIRIDESGYESNARMTSKGKQVLSKGAKEGFASVTTFSHGTDRKIYSYLEYFQKRNRKTKLKKR